MVMLQPVREVLNEWFERRRIAKEEERQKRYERLRMEGVELAIEADKIREQGESLNEAINRLLAEKENSAS